MTEQNGGRYYLLGRLRAMPRRRAARLVEHAGGSLQRRMARNTTHVVAGLGLLDRWLPDKIEVRIAESATSASVIGERAFLRRFDMAPAPAPGTISREALLSGSGLRAHELRLLSLFGAFDADAAPYTFEDMRLARKYAALLEAGATWHDICRTIGQAGRRAALGARILEAASGGILAGDGERRWELTGQLVLDMDEAQEDPEEWFERAADAEEMADYAAAAAAYVRCLSLDPGDAVAAFNRGNCLRALGRAGEAEADYIRALKIDPEFVEAWFNLADVMREQGRVDAARRHLEAALRVDPEYEDAAYNLGVLAFREERLEEAAKWWRRYLELDRDSDWAETAQRGLHFIARATMAS